MVLQGLGACGAGVSRGGTFSWLSSTALNIAGIRSTPPPVSDASAVKSALSSRAFDSASSLLTAPFIITTLGCSRRRRTLEVWIRSCLAESEAGSQTSSASSLYSCILYGPYAVQQNAGLPSVQPNQRQNAKRCDASPKAAVSLGTFAHHGGIIGAERVRHCGQEFDWELHV